MDIWAVSFLQPKTKIFTCLCSMGTKTNALPGQRRVLGSRAGQEFSRQ